MATFRPPAGLGLMILIVVLTLATAFIHLSFGMPIFVLNGIGFLGLLILMYAPVPALVPYQPSVRYVLIGYTVLTIILYFPLGTPYSALGLGTKAIEVLLIIGLLVEASRARAGPAHAPGPRTVGPDAGPPRA